MANVAKGLYMDEKGKVSATAALAREKMRRENGFAADTSYDDAFKQMGWENTSSTDLLKNAAQLDGMSSDKNKTISTEDAQSRVIDKIASGENPYYTAANKLTAPTYKSQYDSTINSLVNQILNGKNSYYDAADAMSAPTYQSQYTEQQAALLQQILNGNNKYYDAADAMTAPTYQSQYTEQQTALLQQILSGQNKHYDVADAMEKPEYESAYGADIEKLLDTILNGSDFKYDINADAAYQQYRDIYERSAKKSANDTMSGAMLASGGYSNSYAQAAAQQAYNAQMQDVGAAIADYEANAYNRFLTERQDDYSKLSSLMSAEDMSYGQYRDSVADYYTDRDYQLAMGDRYADELRTQYGAISDAEARDYGRFQDSLSQFNTDRDYQLAMGDRYADELRTQYGAISDAEARDYGRFQDSLSQFNTDRDYQLAMGDRYADELRTQYGVVSDAEAKDYGRFQDSLSQFNADRDYQLSMGDRYANDLYNQANLYQSIEDFKFKKEQYANDSEYQKAVAAAELGDYSLLGNYLGVDTTEAQKFHNITQAAELYSATGMISFLKNAGLDTTELEAKMKDETFYNKLTTGLAIYEATGDSSQLKALGVNTTYSDKLLNYSLIAAQKDANGSSGSGEGGEKSNKGSDGDIIKPKSKFSGNDTTDYWLSSRLTQKQVDNYNSRRNSSISLESYAGDQLALALVNGEINLDEFNYLCEHFGIK